MTESAQAFPSFDLTGQRALVTGAAHGIGAATALALAHAGADVAVGIRSPGSGESVVEAITALGRSSISAQMDTTDLEKLRRTIDSVETNFGPLDVLVNNVGIGPEADAIDVTEEDFDATVHVNLKGTFFTTQYLGRRMIQRGSGNIIMIGSQAGAVALPSESVYCMTKAAVAHRSRCLAVEWGSAGVRVNTVAPTFIDTPGTATALADPDFRADVEDRIAGLHRSENRWRSQPPSSSWPRLPQV